LADFRIPGAAFLRRPDFNTFVHCYDASDFMFRFVTSGFDTLHRNRWLVLNTFHELEAETLDYLRDERGLRTAATALLAAVVDVVAIIVVVDVVAIIVAADAVAVAVVVTAVADAATVLLPIGPLQPRSSWSKRRQATADRRIPSRSGTRMKLAWRG
jgi:hypothetical protein